MSKALLIISGGIEAIPGIQLAKSMGLYIVVSDMNPNAPGLVFADDHLIVSTYDVEATVAAATHYHQNVRPIDGVMCIASDVPLTVASVAKALNLPGISVESAQLATDKLAMKERFAADGVSIPWFSSVDSAAHLKKIAAERDFPLVLKPVDSRGARGVLRLIPETDLDWAYETSYSHSPTGRVMVEQYLSGPQVSTESMLLDSVAYTPGFADRNYELLEKYSPYIIENGGQLPTHLSEATQQAVRNLVQDAALSMGIKNGIVKGDIVIFEGKPYVIELAARLSGGYFCTHQIPLNTGVDLVGAAIQQALGEEIVLSSLKPKYSRPVAQRYFFPEPGIVVTIGDNETLRSHKDVAYFELRAEVDSSISPIDSHPARAGVVITTGKTREAAVALAEEVVTSIKIEVQPDAD